MNRLEAIKRVCEKRLKRGAKIENIKEYLDKLSLKEENKEIVKSLLELKDKIGQSG